MSKENEKTEKLLGLVADLGSALEAIGVKVKHEAAEIAGLEEAAAVKEETFNVLKFESQKGEKLGDFETASSKNNIPEKYNQAYNILAKSNSTINSRYHGAGYQFSYWIYGDRIFRQVLKQKES